ncbi:NfeD family protein [Porticoccaceae bacterium]|jgi:membrane protein implicated in regulation of membrane protease activity|nr:NfeD family protein [Porticoccaceae bacterium]MDA9919171.1 NfeD family protein [Porticoccaceae bacterium]MDB3966889.1 NfeD family protein [Porticoccaceae bacterium]
MELQMLYWHWLVLGVVLIVAEIFIPSFTILWFGLGALVVGVAALMVEMSLSLQVLLWSIFSVLFTVLWFKLVKPRMVDSSNSQMAREAAIGESGQVIKLPAGDTRGKLRFSTPILGEDEWEFSCDSEVALGDRLHIQEISDSVLIVAKLS